MTNRTSIVGQNSATSQYYEKLQQIGDDTPPALRLKGKWTENDYTVVREYQRQNAVDLYRNGNPSDKKYSSKKVYLEAQSVVFRTDYQDPNFSDVISRLGEEWRGTSLNLAMYLSPEGRESAEMVYGSLLKLSNSARLLKRGDFGGALRNLRELPRRHRKRAADRFNQGDLSGSFLAMHLGWTPLIQDIYTASQPIKFSEKGKKISARKAATPATWYHKNSDLNTITSAKRVGSVSLKGEIGRPPTWTEGLGLTNPFAIAWELVPLSFVADYFLPIGSTLDALGVISQARFNKLFKCTFRRTEISSTLPSGTLMLSPYWKNTQPATLRISKHSYTRTKHTLSFSDVLPMKVTLPTSAIRLSTLAALTHQRILALRR